MEVVKRDESSEPVKLDKITARIKKQTWGLDANYIDYMEVVKKTISGLHDGITTTELDNLAAETAASMTSSHPDYSLLASRIAITRLYKSVPKHFDKVFNVVNSDLPSVNCDKKCIDCMMCYTIGDKTEQIIEQIK